MDAVLIIVFVLLAAVLWFYLKIKIPAKLSHLPSRPVLDYYWDQYSTEPLYKKMESFYFEQLFKFKVMLTYRLGSWNIVVSCPDYAKQFFKDTETVKKIVPSDSHPNRLFSKFLGEAVLFSNDEVWKKHRKICNIPLKKQFQVETFCKASSQLFEVIESHKEDEQLQVHKYMQRLTMEVLGKDIMGVEFDAILKPDVPFIQAYNSIMKGVSAPLPNLFPSFDTESNPFHKFYFDQLQLLDSYFDQILQQKKLDLIDRKLEDSQLDLLSMLIKAKQASNGEFSELDIRNNVMTFIIAGHDTTTFALTSALRYLAENPKVQEEAREEVLRVMGCKPEHCTPRNSKRPTLEQTKQMEYLTAVIKETLRMSPSLPRIPLRRTLKPTQVNGFEIPANSNVTIDVYAMHHDPDNFKDPNNFDPTRFLNVKESDIEGYFPFGGGSRLCMGINFSMLQQKVVLSMVLARYKLSDARFKMSSSIFPSFKEFTMKFNLLDEIN